MAEKEQKLGPNVTYIGSGEGDKTPVTMAGVRFAPGESVNLEERLGPQGQSMLKKLAGNKYFKVDGGPDHEAEAKKRAELEEKEQADEAKRLEDEEKQRQEAAQQTAKQAPAQPPRSDTRTPPPPPDWEGPENEGLEKQPTSRKPR